jgi:hypothetical protein
MGVRSVVGRALVAVLLPACTVGDRYLVPADTWARIQALSPAQRTHTAATVRRVKGDLRADVLTSAFSDREAVQRPDGAYVVPTRLPSRRLVLGSTLVWIGTPISIAGLAMVIWGSDAVRWSGIALSGAAEPVMIAGTVLWVQAAGSHPQEVFRRTDLQYLPFPGAPAGMVR